LPGEAQRKRIWQKVFPAQTPVAEDVDFDFLAKQFKFSGGNIKNVALASAFLAARNEGQVTMTYIILAIRREYQKMGKLCTKSDFGRYFSLVPQEGVS
jgi:ATP-dependent 26S proteasome regulatory subunit